LLPPFGVYGSSFFLFFFLLPPFGVYGSSFLAPIGAAFASSFAGSASALAF
jgi:hypothetical protein